MSIEVLHDHRALFHDGEHHMLHSPCLRQGASGGNSAEVVADRVVEEGGPGYGSGGKTAKNPPRWCVARIFVNGFSSILNCHFTASWSDALRIQP